MRLQRLAILAAACALLAQPVLAADKTILAVKPGMKPETTETRCGVTVIKVALVAYDDDKATKKGSYSRVRSMLIDGRAVSDITLGWINGPRDGYDGGFQGLSITCGDMRKPTVLVAANGYGDVVFEVDSSGFIRKV